MRSELETARNFLLDVLPAGSRVLCAVSGGLDSMCLLHLMNTWGRMREFSVTAAHFNHQLRGKAADRDEAFVRDWCDAQSIPFVSGRGDVRDLAKREGLTVEEAARRLRYAFLRETAEQAGCAAILTAHHADDNAETMLLNLTRGTGSRGLTGIPRARDGILRPFLEIPRAELADYAAAHAIPHVEDETNGDADAAARNLLRLHVMPLLKQLNPRAVENMTRTAAILGEESQALESLAEELAGQAKETPDGLTIPCLVLAEAPKALRDRAVLQLLAKAAGHRKDLTAVHVSAVAELVMDRRPGRELSLPCDLTARRGRYALTLTRRTAPPGPVPLTIGDTVSFGYWTVRAAERPDGPGSPMRLPDGASLTVTAWRSDDRLLLPGSRGRRSFKRLCADRGISPQTRDALPVLRVDGAPAAVPELGVLEDFTPRSGDRTVYVTFYMRIEEKRHEE